MKAAVLLALALIGAAVAEVYFSEEFGKGWEDRWVESTEWKPKSEMGKFVATSGKWYADSDDKGIQTSQDARFYGLSAKMDKPVDNKGKDLVVSYTVKFEQKIDCGGAYIKLLPDMDQKSFGGDTKYSIMFGPDVCGTGTRKTHVIFHSDKKDDNLLTKKSVRCETDQLSHLYTLIVRPDNTYEVQIDQEKVESGSLEDDFDFLPPRKIKDPEAKKPDDWVDEAKIPDPEDKKPEGWDDVPKMIPDPDAEKPEDWDDEEDGEWEPPMIDNPEYKGEWKPRMIDNPDYKGPWIHPEIDNPDFEEDPNLHAVCNPCTHVGFELWQVKSGTIFDDIIVTDSVEEAEKWAEEHWEAKKDAEKEMFDKIEEERQAKEEEERKKAEEERKQREAEEEDEDEDEDEDEADEDL